MRGEEIDEEEGEDVGVGVWEVPAAVLPSPGRVGASKPQCNTNH